MQPVHLARVGGPARNRTLFRSFGGFVATFARTRGAAYGSRTRLASETERLRHRSHQAAFCALVANRTRPHRLRRPRTESIGESSRVTYGFRSRRGCIHSAPGSPAPSRHSLSGENRTLFGSVPNGVPHQSATLRRDPWIPSVPPRALRVFSAPLPLGQLGIRLNEVAHAHQTRLVASPHRNPAGSAYGDRTRLSGVKNRDPHQKTNAPRSWEQRESHPRLAVKSRLLGSRAMLPSGWARTESNGLAFAPRLQRSSPSEDELRALGFTHQVHGQSRG